MKMFLPLLLLVFSVNSWAEDERITCSYVSERDMENLTPAVDARQTYRFFYSSKTPVMNGCPLFVMDGTNQNRQDFFSLMYRVERGGPICRYYNRAHSTDRNVVCTPLGTRATRRP